MKLTNYEKSLFAKVNTTKHAAARTKLQRSVFILVWMLVVVVLGGWTGWEGCGGTCNGRNP